MPVASAAVHVTPIGSAETVEPSAGARMLSADSSTTRIESVPLHALHPAAPCARTVMESEPVCCGAVSSASVAGPSTVTVCAAPSPALTETSDDTTSEPSGSDTSQPTR